MRCRMIFLFTGLCAVLLCAGCGGKQATPMSRGQEMPKAIAESVDEAVDDPVRAQKAKDLAIQLEYAARDYAEEVWKFRMQAFYLNANYDAKPEKFETFLANLEELRSKRQQTLIDRALEARTLLSAEEWAEFHSVLSEKMDSE